jgi:hypothetical protein
MISARSIRNAALALAVTVAARDAAAQSPPVPGVYYPEWYDTSAREREPEAPSFRLINYFLTRASFTNAVGNPSGLRGVSLGPLGYRAGSDVGVTDDVGAGAWVEQRWIPVLEYSPDFINGYAAFRAQFEVDFVWGLGANSIQQNIGGGLNADMVNFQTKNVNVAIYPTRDPDDLTILVGTQPVYDSPLDPTRTPLGDIIRTGYKLAYLGTDATGLSIFSSRFGRSRLSWLPLQAVQSDLADGDPRLKFVWMAMADHQHELAPGTWLGASAWFLRDNSKGLAYAYEGLVRSGPGQNGLSAFTGTQPWQIERPDGWVGWLGLNGHHNLDFRTGRFGASGFVLYNAGKFEANPAGATTLLNEEVSIGGLAANAEVLWNWGGAQGDVASLEAMFATGDDDATDDEYGGPFTLNYYGLPGAVWFNHKTLLLFPFTSTINNYTGAVTDVSNQGAGLAALIASAAWDVVPNKLNLKVGAAHARAIEALPAFAGSTTPRGKTIGTEVNAELKYTMRYLMTFGLHGGYMIAGDFYDGETSRVTEDPFALFTTFTWYAF